MPDKPVPMKKAGQTMPVTMLGGMVAPDLKDAPKPLLKKQSKFSKETGTGQRDIAKDRAVAAKIMQNSVKVEKPGPTVPVRMLGGMAPPVLQDVKPVLSPQSKFSAGFNSAARPMHQEDAAQRYAPTVGRDPRELVAEPGMDTQRHPLDLPAPAEFHLPTDAERAASRRRDDSTHEYGMGVIDQLAPGLSAEERHVAKAFIISRLGGYSSGNLESQRDVMGEKLQGTEPSALNAAQEFLALHDSGKTDEIAKTINDFKKHREHGHTGRLRREEVTPTATQSYLNEFNAGLERGQEQFENVLGGNYAEKVAKNKDSHPVAKVLSRLWSGMVTGTAQTLQMPADVLLGDLPTLFNAEGDASANDRLGAALNVAAKGLGIAATATGVGQGVKMIGGREILKGTAKIAYELGPVQNPLGDPKILQSNTEKAIRLMNAGTIDAEEAHKVAAALTKRLSPEEKSLAHLTARNIIQTANEAGHDISVKDALSAAHILVALGKVAKTEDGAHALTKVKFEGRESQGVKVEEPVAAQVPPVEARVGDAIWRNADVDEPVKVTGTLGEINGRQYVSIEGSKTGVPLDEITFTPKAPAVEVALKVEPQSPKPATEPVKETPGTETYEYQGQKWQFVKAKKGEHSGGFVPYSERDGRFLTPKEASDGKSFRNPGFRDTLGSKGVALDDAAKSHANTLSDIAAERAVNEKRAAEEKLSGEQRMAGLLDRTEVTRGETVAKYHGGSERTVSVKVFAHPDAPDVKFGVGKIPTTIDGKPEKFRLVHMDSGQGLMASFDSEADAIRHILHKNPENIQKQYSTPNPQPPTATTATPKEPWEMTRDSVKGVKPEVRPNGDIEPGGLARHKGTVKITKRNHVNDRGWYATLDDGTVLGVSKDKPTVLRAAKEWAQRQSDNLAKTQHRSEVKQALSEGKPVPAEVLKDYPDLAPKTPIQKVSGKPNYARGNGEKYPVEWKIRELDDLNASHNHNDFTSNPNWKGIGQPRDRSRVEGKLQVKAMAQALDAEQLLESSNQVVHGSPIVDAKGNVEHGNGRTMAIKLAAESHPEQYEAYRKALIAEHPEAANFQKPVLVRERIPSDTAWSDAEIEKYTKIGTSGEGKGLSAAEVARSDAKGLPEHYWDNFEHSGDNFIDSVNSPANHEKVVQFIKRQSGGDQSVMLTASGEFSTEGAKRIERAALFHLMGEGGMKNAEKILENGEIGARIMGGLKQSLLPLLKVRTDRLSEIVNGALTEYTKFKEGKFKNNFEEYMAQGRMDAVDPDAIQLLKELQAAVGQGGSQTKVAEVFKNLAENPAIKKEHSSINQDALFQRQIDTALWDKTLREAEAKGANLDNAFAGFGYTDAEKKYLLAHAGVKHILKAEPTVTESLFGGDTLFQNNPDTSKRIAENNKRIGDKLKEHFGVTHDPMEAGYVTSDGEMIDMSGRHEGNTTPGVRWVDHRDLPDSIREEVKGTGFSDGLIHVIRRGVARMAIQKDLAYFDIGSPVTQRQSEVMANIARRGGVLEVTDLQGITVFSEDFKSAGEFRRALKKANEIAAKESGRPNEPLFQPTSIGPKGQYVYDAATKTGVVTLFKNADITTVLHETAHHYLHYMPENQLQAFAKSLGITSGKPLNEMSKEDYHNVQEHFARGLESAIHGGTMKDANPQVQAMFDRAAKRFHDIYGEAGVPAPSKFKGGELHQPESSEGGFKLPPEAADIFARMMNGEVTPEMAKAPRNPEAPKIGSEDVTGVNERLKTPLDREGEVKPGGTSREKLEAEAKGMNIDVGAAVKRAINGEGHLNEHETVAATTRKAEIVAEMKKMESQGKDFKNDPEYQKLYRENQDLRDAVQTTQTEGHRLFTALQGGKDAEGNLITKVNHGSYGDVMTEIDRVNPGEAARPSVQAEVQKMTAEVAALEEAHKAAVEKALGDAATKHAELTAKLQDAEAELARLKASDAVASHNRTNPRNAKAVARNMADAETRIRKFLGNEDEGSLIGRVLNQDPVDADSLNAAIRDFAKAHVHNGVKGLSNVVKKIQETFPELEGQAIIDAIAEPSAPKTRTEIQKAIADLKAESKKASTDRQSKVAELEARKAEKLAADAIKKNESRAIREQRAKEAKRLREIADNEKAVEAARAKSEREANRRAKSADAKNEREVYGKPKAIQDNIDALTERLRTGDFDIESKTRKTATAEVERLRKERDDLRRSVAPDNKGLNLDAIGAKIDALRGKEGMSLEELQKAKKDMTKASQGLSRGSEVDVDTLAIGSGDQFGSAIKDPAVGRLRVKLTRAKGDLDAMIATAEAKQTLKEGGWFTKAYHGVAKPVNRGIRTILTSFDHSIPGRQGFDLLISNPKQWGKLWWNSWKGFSEDGLIKILGDVENHKHFNQVMEDGRLALTGVQHSNEYDFNHATKLDRLPGIAQSENLATAFSTPARMFEYGKQADMLEQLQGSPLTKAQRLMVADHVNSMTGKGSIPKKMDFVRELAFSAQYQSSRLESVFGTHIFKALAAGDKPMAKMFAKAYAKKVLVIGATLAALHEIKDDKGRSIVEIDPRSPDFGTVRLGKSTLDLTGGRADWIRFFFRGGAKLRGVEDTKKSMTDPTEPGKLSKSSGTTLLSQFALGKMAPVPGLVASRLTPGLPDYQKKTLGDMIPFPIGIKGAYTQAQNKVETQDIARNMILEFLGGKVGGSDTWSNRGKPAMKKASSSEFSYKF